MFPPFRFEVEKPLDQYSTFGIGGPARFFIEITKIEQMQAIIAYCAEQHLSYIVIGKGSNCLFDDRGFDGLVILNKIAFCQFDWPLVSVGAGYSFSLLGSQTARKGWSGLEFASGIPGTVGGAVYMNAGASRSETQEALMEVSYVNEKGGLEILLKNQITFSYRFSSFQEKKGAIVAAKFVLIPSEQARKKQLSIIEYRTRTQPYHDKSAGCVFRNPSIQQTSHPVASSQETDHQVSSATSDPVGRDSLVSHSVTSRSVTSRSVRGLSAGALIQQAGLKGACRGDAEVSTLHANFIVNKGRAKAEDVVQLAEHVRRIVKEKTGEDLEMEIRRIPYQIR